MPCFAPVLTPAIFWVFKAKEGPATKENLDMTKVVCRLPVQKGICQQRIVAHAFCVVDFIFSL